MRASKISLAPLAGALLLAGCVVKSPPTTAEIQKDALTPGLVPNAWKAGGASGHVTDNWLASFGDAQLDALVAEAIAHNPDLRVSATRVEQANQYVELAKAALRPTISVLGTGGAKMGGGDVSSALQGISLGASWEPDLWGRMRYGRNAAQEQEASVKADFEFARQSIAAAVARGWFTASETWLQLQISEGMVNSLQDLVTLAEKRRSIGVGVEQDVALARANVENARDTAQQIRLAHGNALRALELLLGRYPAAELAARHELAALPPPVPAGFPLEMLERRPDMVAAERRVAAAFNRVGEAKAAQLPRITLNANVAAISSEILQLQRDYENPSAGIGGRLNAPLYTGGALQTQVAIRTLEQKEAVADYARLALRALGDVENILAATAALDERQRMLEQALVDQQHALELIQSSEKVGRTDQRSIRQQQLNRDAALLTLLRVQSEQLSQRVNLHLALGGSFQQPANLTGTQASN